MTTQASKTLRASTVALRLGMCAAALAGTMVMAPASAVVVTFSTPTPVPNSFDGIYINLLTGASGVAGSGVAGWDFNPYNSGAGLSFFWNSAPSAAGGVATAATGGTYIDMAPGTTISAASTFTAIVATAATAAFKTAGTHTLGVRFYNENTAAINYGYVTLTSAGGTGFPLTVTGWTFENSGAAITTPVPEASTTAMFSLGALALGALNLRKLRRARKLAA